MKSISEEVCSPTVVEAMRILVKANRRHRIEDGEDAPYVRLTQNEFNALLDWVSEIKELFYLAGFWLDESDKILSHNEYARNFEATFLEGIAYGMLDLYDPFKDKYYCGTCDEDSVNWSQNS